MESLSEAIKHEYVKKTITKDTIDDIINFLDANFTKNKGEIEKIIISLNDIKKNTSLNDIKNDKKTDSNKIFLAAVISVIIAATAYAIYSFSKKKKEANNQKNYSY